MLLFWSWVTSIVFGLVLLAACIFLLGWFTIYVVLALLLFHGWVLFLFFHYRFLRQEEFLHLLTTTVEAGVPLSSALDAYVRDRPRDAFRGFWIATLQMFVLPGYYWLWHRGNSYDRRVERVAVFLRAGYSLPSALRAIRGVASRETELAAAVGEATGKLEESLHAAPRWRLAPVWLAATPRLLYPLLLLLTTAGVLVYLSLIIVPRFERIFAEFGLPLPEATEWVFAGTRALVKFWPWIALGAAGALGFVATMFFNSTVCWHTPLVRRFYRAYVQGRFLRMLAVLLEAGKPLPEALSVLAETGYFRGAARLRIDWARSALEEGMPLPESLRRAALLPQALVPLVETAQRAGNLPWSLAELGDMLGQRVIHHAHRLIMASFLLAILACGTVIGFVVFGFFTPLIALMSGI